jgi:hypothetical protein
MTATPSYPPAIQNLLGEARLNPLGPGRPNEAVRSVLQAMTVDQLFAPRRIRDADMASACLGALWLYHDFLDEGHAICQDIDTTEGSYWHGIMHRREPDAGNAKYWFRKVGNHAIFPALHESAAKFAAQEGKLEGAAAFLRTQSTWDPFEFIDLCEQARLGRTQCEILCKRIQAREWELLFAHCYQHAVAE